MTQLQIIIEEFKKIQTGPVLIKLWKEDALEGNVITIIAKIRKLIKEESPVWYSNNLGEKLVDAILEFNPVAQAEVMLEELNQLWQTKWKVNRQSKDFAAIIKMNKDITTLFEMAKL